MRLVLSRDDLSPEPLGNAIIFRQTTNTPTGHIGLRWLVSVAAAFLAYKEFEPNGRNVNIYAALFGAMALLMNAIIPVELPAMAWAVINLCYAGFFVAHMKSCTPKS